MTEPIHVVFNDYICAPAETVFKLCCPVEEYKWIPGWKCNLIHCPNDRVEEGTVFSEILSAPFLNDGFVGKTVWTAISHEPENNQVVFRLVNRISSSIYKIGLAGDKLGNSTISLDLTYTPIGKTYSRRMSEEREKKIHAMLSILSLMLKHYSEKGFIIPASSVQKAAMGSQELGYSDKLHLGFNYVAMLIAGDKNRSRFMIKKV